MAVVLVGCATSPKETTSKETTEKPQPTKGEPANIADPIVEAAIRKELKKPTGKLTKADYEKVTRLNLYDNRLTEVPKGLEKLTKLEWLGLRDNKLTSVKGLENLTKLEWLFLGGNQLTEVPKGLEKLTQLTRLLLNNNKLTNVKGLEKLTQLTGLDLQDNPNLTKAQIAELKKALPKCDIYSNPTK